MQDINPQMYQDEIFDDIDKLIENELETESDLTDSKKSDLDETEDKEIASTNNDDNKNEVEQEKVEQDEVEQDDMESNYSKLQAFCAAFYMRKNFGEINDLRMKLDKALDDGDIVGIEYCYKSAMNLSAPLPMEVLEKARLTISLFNAMNENKIDDIVSYIHQADQLLLGDTIKYYQMAKCFLKINKSLNSYSNNLKLLKDLYDQIIAICPDVPNLPLLYDKIYKTEVKNTFAKMVEKAIKTMILIDIEDALIYGNMHNLNNSRLYSKLEKLFNHEQNRRYIYSKRALSNGINFDQIFFEEDKIKLLNYENGKNNFKCFKSPFSHKANKHDDDDNDSDTSFKDNLSMSWDADLAVFAQIGGSDTNEDQNVLLQDLDDQIDDETANAIGINNKVTNSNDDIEIEELSEENDSEYSINTDMFDVDDILNMNDVVDEFNADIGNEDAMEIDEIAKLDRTVIQYTKYEPFVPFCTEIDALTSTFESLSEEYGEDIDHFEKLRPLKSFKKFFSKRKMFYFGVRTINQMLSHTTKCIPRSITYLNTETCGSKERTILMKKTAERLFNIS